MTPELFPHDLLQFLQHVLQMALTNTQWIPWDNLPSWSIPLLIFLLRSSDLTLATLRTLSVLRGRRASAWILGFLQALLFITGFLGVLGNLDQWINLFAYAAGMATGSAIGMTLEAIYAPGHSTLRVISRTKGNAIAEALRAGNHGVTEITARGLSGTVEIIWCNLRRKDVNNACSDVTSIDEEAFVTVDPVKSLHGGWQA